MTQEIINIGTTPNDGEGDPLRTAFAKSCGGVLRNTYNFHDSPPIQAAFPPVERGKGR